jgi:hypothetical protein
MQKNWPAPVDMVDIGGATLAGVAGAGVASLSLLSAAEADWQTDNATVIVTTNKSLFICTPSGATGRRPSIGTAFEKLRFQASNLRPPKRVQRPLRAAIPSPTEQ